MTSNNQYNIKIVRTEEEFDNTAARLIIGQMRRNAQSVIGLSTGKTTYNIHRLVVKLFNEHPFPIGDVTFFGIDEVVGVDRNYAGACYTMLKTELIDDLGVDSNHFLMFPTQSEDFPRTCRQFISEIERRAGIDLLILGLGENAHLGFNQPGTSLEQEAWVTEMNPELEERIRCETQTPEGQWLGGVTLGLKDILRARSIVLVAKGEHKAEAVYRMLQGVVTSQCPASVLQRHSNCLFLLDMKAASLINKNENQ